MSSYGGGNGFFYGNPYFDMCLNTPQPVNVVNVTNHPVIIKCERQDNGIAAPALRQGEIGDLVKSSPFIPTPKIEEQPPQKEEEASPEAVEEEEEEQPELDIMVNNVVCSFNVRCHLNLRQIALNGSNVEYRRENGMVTMKLRKPSATASIWSSGKITCTGSTSNDDALRAARIIARKLQHLGFRVRFTNFRVVNVLCTCIMNFGINLIKFTQKHRTLTCYEPELHPGATYRIKDLKATLKLFTTGSITVTAPSIQNADLAIKHIFPLVEEFKTKKAAIPTKSSQIRRIPRMIVQENRYDDSSDDYSSESED